MTPLRPLAALALSLALSTAGCTADAPANDDTEEGVDDSALTSCGALASPADADAATSLWAAVPPRWRTALSDERRKDYFPRLAGFVATSRAGARAVFPPPADTFTALRLTAPDDVKVVILGQDPYIKAGQAHGLAFSVKAPTTPPPSLRNILHELRADLPAIEPVSHGSLEAWAKQGVLLLNAVLTVEEGRPGSHACHGWETFTDAVIRTISARREPVVFVLWGSFAQSKLPLIDARHVIIKGAHPSPKSADHGFFGSRPFSQVNDALTRQREQPIDWQLPR